MAYRWRGALRRESSLPACAADGCFMPGVVLVKGTAYCYRDARAANGRPL